MLSRTAGNLFWTGRYVERADFLSRLTEATLRLAALPSGYGGDVAAWRGALAAAGVSAAYDARHPVLDEATTLQFLSLDPDNPSSMRSCVEQARANARAVRTALTAQTWEAINSAWIDVQNFGIALQSRNDLNGLLEAVKTAALSFDGASHRSMLRHDSYWFLRLGATLERADNTARLLDVKYHLLLPRDEAVGGSLDYFQWATILRTVSALTAYRHVYSDAIRPANVADLLILNRRMPRSLAACTSDTVRYLDQLAESSGRRGPANRLAVAAANRLTDATIKTVFDAGMHEYVSAFIDDNSAVADAVAEQFLF